MWSPSPSRCRKRWPPRRPKPWEPRPRRPPLRCGHWRYHRRRPRPASSSSRSKPTPLAGSSREARREPNSLVRLYLNGAEVGDAKPKSDGRWSLTIERGMTAVALCGERRRGQPGHRDGRCAPRRRSSIRPPAFAGAPPAATSSAPAGRRARQPPPRQRKCNRPNSRRPMVAIDLSRPREVVRGHTRWGRSVKTIMATDALPADRRGEQGGDTTTRT